MLELITGYIGSSLLVILIAYIIVDTFHCKKVNLGIVTGRVVLLVILYLGLARTL